MKAYSSHTIHIHDGIGSLIGPIFTFSTSWQSLVYVKKNDKYKWHTTSDIDVDETGIESCLLIKKSSIEQSIF